MIHSLALAIRIAERKVILRCSPLALLFLVADCQVKQCMRNRALETGIQMVWRERLLPKLGEMCMDIQGVKFGPPCFPGRLLEIVLERIYKHVFVFVH